MAMETVFETFFNVATVVMCLGIFIITHFIRRIIETKWTGVKANKWWAEIVLPFGAIIIGAFIAWIAKKFPIPVELSPSAAGRLMYGAICGLMSTFVYNRVKAWIKASGVAPSQDDPVSEIAPPSVDPTKKDEPTPPTQP